MNRRNMLGLATVAALVFLAVGPAGVAGAADLYSSGGKTWDTTTANWGNAPGVYTGTIWSNATPDSAFFEGTAGTVALGANITVSNIIFKTGAYTLNGGDKTLAFVAGGTITNSTSSLNQTIVSAITGSPSVGITSVGSVFATGITFAPTNGTVTLGTCTVPYNGGSGDKCTLTLDGTTTGNSITTITNRMNYAYVTKANSSTWTVGDVTVGRVSINAGSWIETGTINGIYEGVRLSGGVLHYNNARAVGTINTAGGGYIYITGGAIDNSSGAAITTSTYNPPHTWAGSWTFIGSSGANSDLNIGTGKVTLVMSPTVTVSNATTTLTVGGVITSGTASYALTKAGAGTLKLTGKNTYKGPTTVNAGTLVITQACLSASAGVYVASGGAKLNLNFIGTNNVLAVFLDGSLSAAGTWGATGSGAANIDDTHFSGTGVLSHNGGLVPTNTWHWDGSNYGGTGDGLSAGGNGIWSVSSNNWDQGIVSRKVWPNTTNDMAFFNTVAGTVTLGSSLTLGSLDIRGVDNYTIGGASETNTLNFGGTNTITVYGQNATFNAGISGYPSVNFDGGLKTLRLQPAATVNMNLGTIKVTQTQGGDSYLYLDGSSAGNTVGDMTWPSAQWLRIYKQGLGTWTVNGAINAAGGAVLVPGISAGTLIISTSGSMYMTQGFTLNGGALHLNNPGAYRGSTMVITSGSLDNSRGSAITTSTYNPAQSWGGNFTFLGSQGTNSDLYLGNGAVTLTVSPVVTINSNATLTVGGVISGAGFGLTKSGTGALKLSGNNTYSGATMVTNGTLQLVAGSSCSNSAVTVTNTTGITSAFGVVVTNSAQQAVCSNLTVSAVAGGAAQLKFSFSVAPSFVQAPLVIRNTLAFSGSPTLVVAPANLAAGKKYPLLTVGVTRPGTVPTLSITGMSGTLAWEGNTLYLSMTPNGTLISFF